MILDFYFGFSKDGSWIIFWLIYGILDVLVFSQLILDLIKIELIDQSTSGTNIFGNTLIKQSKIARLFYRIILIYNRKAANKCCDINVDYFVVIRLLISANVFIFD